ncbi:MAG: AAA family ATPase [Desulfovibrio sp.]|jgi:replicative DNA helicase|nr:AAA family ATPase [Desulfovibrio sp.]
MTDAFQSRLDQEMDFVSSLLTGIQQNTVRASDVIAVCPPEHLTPGTRQHTVYHAIAELAAKGVRPSLEAVWTHIHAKQSEPAGKDADAPNWRNVTAESIAAFTMSIFGSREDAIMHYALAVRRESLKRKAEGKLMALVRECQKYGNDPSEIAASLSVIAADMDGGPQEEHTIDGALDRMIAALESGEAAKPMPTPWPGLNRVLKGGFVGGELVILAGRPGTGKTALAGCIAVESAKADIPTLFVSREVSEYTLSSRITSRESRIDMRYFRQGIEHASDILYKIRKTRDGMRGLPLRIIEKSTAPMTPNEVRRLAKTTRGLGLVVVDYLQLMIPDAKQQSREREIADMTRYFKQLAMDCKVPVLLLSQLNRRSEESERTPQLSDLRESGAIEQDADIVIMLYTRKIDNKQARPPVHAIVAKGRSSGTGTAYLRFNKPFADFEENDDDGFVFIKNSNAVDSL